MSTTKKTARTAVATTAPVATKPRAAKSPTAPVEASAAAVAPQEPTVATPAPAAATAPTAPAASPARPAETAEERVARLAARREFAASDRCVTRPKVGFCRYTAVRLNRANARMNAYVKQLRQVPDERAVAAAEKIAAAQRAIEEATEILSDLPKETAPRKPGAPAGGGTARVAKELAVGAVVAVRKGATKQYEDLLTAEQMAAMTVVEVKGKWLVVKYPEPALGPTGTNTAHIKRGHVSVQ